MITVQAMGDVVVAPPLRFTHYPEFTAALEELDAVDAATVALSGQGLLWLGPGNVRAAKIWGVEPDARSRVTGLKDSLLRQKDSSDPVSFDWTSQSGTAEGVGGFVGIAVGAEKAQECPNRVVCNEIVDR